MKWVVVTVAALLAGACGSAGNPNAPAYSSCGAWHSVYLVDSMGVSNGDTAICIQPQ
ncbi:MAG TPA: hypothetical protein VLT79_05640 [Gemmatimonadales bacterium]|nr:hypothetical protein [Gemmatimonadales bacterium]